MNKKIKTYCHKCKNDTNQEIIFDETELDTREIFFVSLKGESRWVVEQREWLISKCTGCDILNMRIKTSHIGNKNTSSKLFPGKVNRIPPSWIFGLEKKYIELLSEVYSAFNNNLFRLTSMGIRTLFDMLMTEKISDQGTFKKNIDKFAVEGYLNTPQKKLLETIIEAGHAAAHRGYKASKDTLTTLLEISEHLLQTEVLENKSKVIHKQIPKRKRISSA